MIAVGLTLLAGCGGKPSDNAQPAQLPLAGVKLRLAVMDDPAMAAAIGRLRGEWTAQTGSELEVESAAAGAALPGCDAVICPSWQLGPLAEGGQLAPLPQGKASGAGPSAASAEAFELLRQREAKWGRSAMAVPFGSPVLVCYYRADLLRKLNRRPPATWDEYLALAEALADRAKLGDAAPAADVPWSATLEPLGPGWAGLTLLARAAPYAQHRSNFSTLFDIKTMEPLVAGPPFVRALEELVAAARLGSADQLRFSPADVRAAFWQGRCGIALSWPTAARAAFDGPPPTGSAPAAAAKSVEAGFAALPGSDQAYDAGNRRWDRRTDEEEPSVPLLMTAGRVGSISSRSQQADAALQLLLWLSDDTSSVKVSAVSPATTLFRAAHTKSPQAWVEPQVSAAAAAQYAAAVAGTLGGQQSLAALRIPGRADYLAALDEAVQQAVRGEATPAAALQAVAERWRATTQQLGVDKQRLAYRRCLGLEP